MSKLVVVTRALPLLPLLPLLGLAACSESVAAEPRERAAERVLAAELAPIPPAAPVAALPSASPVSEESYKDGNTTDAASNQLLFDAATLIQKDKEIPSVVKRGLQVGVRDGRIIVRGKVPDEKTKDRIEEQIEKIAPVQNEVVVAKK